MTDTVKVTIWLRGPFGRQQTIEDGIDAVSKWAADFDGRGCEHARPFSFPLRIRRDFLRAKGAK